MQPSMNKTSRILIWTITLILIASFVGIGLGQSSPAKGPVAAKVGKESIFWNEIDHIAANNQENHNEFVGSKSDQILDEERKQKILQGVISRSAVIQGLEKDGFHCSEQQIIDLIKDLPYFQVKDVFDYNTFKTRVPKGSFGYNILKFNVYEQLIVSALNQSNFSLPYEIKNISDLFTQSRDFSVLTIPADYKKDEIKIKEEELRAYYDENKAQFKKPEQVKLQFLKLSLQPLMQAVKVDDNKLNQYYQSHQALFTSPLKVNCRHILISVPAKAKQEAVDAARNKAELLLSEIKQGKSFVELAKAESSDQSSAANGGELGWFEAGEMVQEFEQAAFNLKKSGDMAGPIKTQFGYHIIELIKREDSKVRPMASVKERVEENYRREQAEPSFMSRVEQLRELIKENPKSLELAAKQLRLPIEISEKFDRLGGIGLASNPKILHQAFTGKIIDDKSNSDLIELDLENFIVFRLSEHFPSLVPPFELIKPEVQNICLNRKIISANKELAENILKEVLADKNSLSKLASQYKLKRESYQQIDRFDNKLSPELLNIGFSLLPESNFANYVQLNNGAIAICAVDRVIQNPPTELQLARLKDLEMRLIETKTVFENSSYFTELLQRIKQEIFKRVI